MRRICGCLRTASGSVSPRWPRGDGAISRKVCDAAGHQRRCGSALVEVPDRIRLRREFGPLQRHRDRERGRSCRAEESSEQAEGSHLARDLWRNLFLLRLPLWLGRSVGQLALTTFQASTTVA